jgi:O-antigen/teichoic acid export membrane protein
MLHYLFAYFVKTLQMVRLFAVCSVIGTAITLLLDVLFLAVLKIGVVGYLLAIILSDAVCTLLLFLFAKIYQYIRPAQIKKAVTRAMLKYSIPLIPTTALWWVTDVSDRYMVTYMIDEAANGLYAVSYKIPNLLILISGIFMDAWQMSVLTEKSRLERQKFFSNIFILYVGNLIHNTGNNEIARIIGYSIKSILFNDRVGENIFYYVHMCSVYCK